MMVMSLDVFGARSSGPELGEELFRGSGDIANGCVECGLVHGGGSAKAAHLADELEGRGGHLSGSRKRFRLRAAQNFYAAAHNVGKNYYATGECKNQDWC
jgi:hypothetical protein